MLYLADGDVTAMEGPLRWQHPSEGLLAPAECVTVAQNIGQIARIGAWVLVEACAQPVSWDRYHPRLSI